MANLSQTEILGLVNQFKTPQPDNKALRSLQQQGLVTSLQNAGANARNTAKLASDERINTENVAGRASDTAQVVAGRTADTGTTVAGRSGDVNRTNLSRSGDVLKEIAGRSAVADANNAAMRPVRQSEIIQNVGGSGTKFKLSPGGNQLDHIDLQNLVPAPFKQTSAEIAKLAVGTGEKKKEEEGGLKLPDPNKPGQIGAIKFKSSTEKSKDRKKTTKTFAGDGSGTSPEEAQFQELLLVIQARLQAENPDAVIGMPFLDPKLGFYVVEIDGNKMFVPSLNQK